MKFLAIPLLMMSLTAVAQHRVGEPLQILFSSSAVQEICADVVTAHPSKPGFWHLERPNFALSETTLFATRHLRPNVAGEFAIVAVSRAEPTGFTEVTRFTENPRDISFHGGKLWVLFPNRLLSLNPEDGSVISEARTQNPGFAPETHAAAHAMTWVGDRLLIAHGTQGLMVYDAQKNTIHLGHNLGLLEQGGHQSKAIAVTPINDHQALVVVDNVTLTREPPFAFNGLMIVDVSGRFYSVTKLPSHRESSGNLSNARAEVVGDKVVINNWGILQVASLSQMKSARAMRSTWRPTRVEMNGQNLFAELMGDMFVENGQVLACSQVYAKDANTGRPTRFGLATSHAME